MNTANKENCLKLYGLSGWLPDDIWMKQSGRWAVGSNTNYLASKASYDDWLAPAYNRQYLLDKLNIYFDTTGLSESADELCLLAFDLCELGAIDLE